MTHPEPYIVSRLIRTEYLHREFPVLVARVKQAKRMKSWADDECLLNVRRG